ncbi:MAG: glycoside hydrolase family 20 zincin-like fold domain-containing protein, partial [bacterium]
MIRAIYKLSVVCLLVDAFCCRAAAQEMAVRVIPQPQEVTLFDAQFTFNPNSKIVLGQGSSQAESFIVSQLNDRIKELGQTPLPVLQENEVSHWSNVVYFANLKQSKKAREMAEKANFSLLMDIGQQGYFLQVSDSLIVVFANAARGLFYGCMSLNQMLQGDSHSIRVSGATIYDWPAFEIRGISDDISHGQISTLADFKRIIRFLGRYKMNTYLLDLNGAFRFANHPEISKNRDVLTKEEVTELANYAQRYYVDLLPVFETLGHLENILMLPDYRDLAEFPGASAISPANQQTYKLLDELIFELADAFPSPYFHIGGGGGQEIGWGASKRLVEGSGLVAVLASHYNHVYDIAKSYSKKVLLDSDMISEHPAILSQIPNEIVVVCRPRHAEDSLDEIEFFQKAGRTFMVASDLHTSKRLFPDYAKAFVEMKRRFRKGYEAGALGAVASSRDDLSSVAFREYNVYGYA